MWNCSLKNFQLWGHEAFSNASRENEVVSKFTIEKFSIFLNGKIVSLEKIAINEIGGHMKKEPREKIFCMQFVKTLYFYRFATKKCEKFLTKGTIFQSITVPMQNLIQLQNFYKFRALFPSVSYSRNCSINTSLIEPWHARYVIKSMHNDTSANSIYFLFTEEALFVVVGLYVFVSSSHIEYKNNFLTINNSPERPVFTTNNSDQSPALVFILVFISTNRTFRK